MALFLPYLYLKYLKPGSIAVVKLIALSILLFASPILAKSKEYLPQVQLDSLEHLLQKAPEDSGKVKLYFALSNGTADFKKAKKYATEALTLSEKILWRYGKAVSLQLIGRRLLEMEDFQEAINFSSKALHHFEELNDTAGIIETLYDIGHEFDYLSNCSKVLDYYSKGLDFSESTGNERMSMLGNVFLSETFYYYLKDFKKVEELSETALKLATKLHDEEYVAYAYFNLCLAYIEQGRYAEAKTANSKSNEYYNKISDYSSIAMCLSNKGNIARKENLPEEALRFDLEAQEVFKKALPNKYQEGTILMYLGDNYLMLYNAGKKGKNATTLMRAKEYYLNALQKFNAIEGKYDLINAYYGLSKVEEFLGNCEDAFRYSKLYISLKDSVFSTESNNKRAYLEKQKHESQQQKTAYEHRAEMQASMKETQRQKEIRNFLILATMLIGISLLMVFRQRNKYKKEKQRSDKLLLNILPFDIAEELKDKGTSEAKLYNNVTVLFTDFVNFTVISSKLTPTELVTEINILFRAFDEIMDRNGLEKIKTIGDAYLSVCGLPNADHKHAHHAINAAKEIIDFVNERRANGGLFEIRVGLNTGPVVAGIVGIRKFAYDIWGDTVNLANRMESSGERGKINISGSTYELVKDDYNCIYRGKVEAKGKGLIDMYFVT